MADIIRPTTEPASSAARAGAPARMPQGESGFALVTVIIVLGAIAYLVISGTAAVRTTLRQAATSEAALQASLAADGGIELGIELLLDAARRDDLRHMGGKRVDCLTPGGDILRIDIGDDAGRVDLNIARPELITALLLGLGLDAEEAARVSDGIADYRDSDNDVRRAGAEAAEYRAAGRTGPANAAFSSIDELAHVLAVSPELHRRLRPFVTVGSRLSGIDPRQASPELLELVANGTHGGAPLAARPGGASAGSAGLNAAFVAASVYRSYTVRAVARVRAGAVQMREASIELVPARRPPIQPTLSQRRGRTEPQPAALVTRWSYSLPVAADAIAQSMAIDMTRC